MPGIDLKRYSTVAELGYPPSTHDRLGNQSGTLYWIDSNQVQNQIFPAAAGGFTNFIMSDGSNTQTVDDGETQLFSGSIAIDGTVGATNQLTLNWDITKLASASGTLTDSDYLGIYDLSGVAHQRIALSDLPTITTLDSTNDKFPVIDATDSRLKLVAADDFPAGAGGTDLQWTNATELTIATGAVTITQGYHSIDTEADAASDDLDTISGGTAGQEIRIFAISDARTVVVKNGTGNILTYGGNDISLDEDHKILALIYDGTNWREISNNSALTALPSDNYELNEGADYTTTSPSFVDIDATNLSRTIVTTGRDVVVVANLTHQQSAVNKATYFNIDVDGAVVAAEDGICVERFPTTGDRRVTTLVWLVTGLSAASHTFKLQWKVSSGTATLHAGAGTANADVHGQMWVKEVS